MATTFRRYSHELGRIYLMKYFADLAPTPPGLFLFSMMRVCDTSKVSDMIWPFLRAYFSLQEMHIDSM